MKRILLYQKAKKYNEKFVFEAGGNSDIEKGIALLGGAFVIIIKSGLID